MSTSQWWFGFFCAWGIWDLWDGDFKGALFCSLAALAIPAYRAADARFFKKEEEVPSPPAGKAHKTD